MMRAPRASSPMGRARPPLVEVVAAGQGVALAPADAVHEVGEELVRAGARGHGLADAVGLDHALVGGVAHRQHAGDALVALGDDVVDEHEAGAGKLGAPPLMQSRNKTRS